MRFRIAQSLLPSHYVVVLGTFSSLKAFAILLASISIVWLCSGRLVGGLDVFVSMLTTWIAHSRRMNNLDDCYVVLVLVLFSCPIGGSRLVLVACKYRSHSLRFCDPAAATCRFAVPVAFGLVSCAA